MPPSSSLSRSRSIGFAIISSNLHILTGAPGVGKTTVLDHVGAGIHRVGEPAREILADQRASGGAGTHDGDPTLFVDLLLRRSIDKHEAAGPWEGLVVFDRGVPDCIAYATLMGLDPTPSVEAARRYRYHPEVLVLEPWEEIYSVDDERTMSFEDTLGFHEAIVEAYTGAGYSLVAVPRDSLESRAAFVRDVVTRP